MSTRLFEKAKQRSLTEVVLKAGFDLRKQGMRYAAKHCPHCDPGLGDAMSIFQKGGVWRWNCFRCNRGGTVIDFAAAVWGISEREAAIRLANDDEIGQAVVIKENKPAVTPEITKSTLGLIARHGHTSVRECLDYLQSRGISEKTATDAVRRGLLRFLPANPFQANKFLNEKLGIEKLRESGLLKPEARWPGIAFRPMVFFFPGFSAAEFRLAREPKDGEPKAVRYGNAKWPWWWKAGETVSTIHIVEGAIDLLSRVEMGLKEGEALIAIPGTSSWRPEWISAVYNAHPKAKFVLGLDADEPGQQASEGMHEALAGLGASVTEIVPSVGKDWNEYLLSRKAA